MIRCGGVAVGSGDGQPEQVADQADVATASSRMRSWRIGWAFMSRRLRIQYRGDRPGGAGVAVVDEQVRIGSVGTEPLPAGQVGGHRLTGSTVGGRQRLNHGIICAPSHPSFFSHLSLIRANSLISNMMLHQ